MSIHGKIRPDIWNEEERRIDCAIARQLFKWGGVGWNDYDKIYMGYPPNSWAPEQIPFYSTTVEGALRLDAEISKSQPFMQLGWNTKENWKSGCIAILEYLREEKITKKRNLILSRRASYAANGFLPRWVIEEGENLKQEEQEIRSEPLY